jgi:phosphatidylglycerophosphate synthase
MSIRSAPLLSPPHALIREAQVVFASALGLAVAATTPLILCGVVEAVPGIVGLTLFAGILVTLARQLTGYHPFPRLGTANRITLVRAGVACLIAGRALDAAPIDIKERWIIVCLAGAALLLDGADGWAARRQGLASAFGARFDMETDAFAIAVLALTVARAGSVPCWVLAIGAMRYLYLGAGYLLPLLRVPAPASAFADRRRKTIAVVQSLALLVALAPATSPGWAEAACALALGLLGYSFAADIAMQFADREHK